DPALVNGSGLYLNDPRSLVQDLQKIRQNCSTAGVNPAAKAIISSINWYVGLGYWYSSEEERIVADHRDLSNLVRLVVEAMKCQAGHDRSAARQAAQTLVASLLREIVPNPFRPAQLDPRWLSPNVMAIAQGIDAEGAFKRLPILADA